jgi:hypothetical protein
MDLKVKTLSRNLLVLSSKKKWTTVPLNFKVGAFRKGLPEVCKIECGKSYKILWEKK